MHSSNDRVYQADVQCGADKNESMRPSQLPQQGAGRGRLGRDAVPAPACAPLSSAPVTITFCPG